MQQYVDQCSNLHIHKPDRAGNLQYESVEYTGSDKGEETIDKESGSVEGDRAGVFKSRNHAVDSIAAEKIRLVLTLTVNKAKVSIPELGA